MNRKDDLLIAVILAAFFAAIFAGGYWGWFNATTQEAIRLFLMGWAVFTWAIYMALRTWR